VPSASDHLPHVDEHATEVDADAEVVWRALVRVIEATFGSPRTAHFARLLGCADSEPAGPRPLDASSAFSGFHVESAAPASELALAGSHRFSTYTLIFRLDGLGDGRTRLRAETRAEFPGLRGSAYRALVIGSRAHVLVTRRLLGAVKARASTERTSPTS
jgi:hypothetical protein